MKSVSRSAFLKSAGVAAGAAAISASPAVAAATGEPAAIEIAPTTPIPNGPVIAIVRDARLGEVTVLSGTTEKTYTDRLLAKRLVKAAALNAAAARGEA